MLPALDADGGASGHQQGPRPIAGKRCVDGAAARPLRERGLETFVEVCFPAAGQGAGFTVPTSAHRSRYIRCFDPVGALPLLWKPLLLASIANSSSNLAASQAGRRRFESGRPLLQVMRW